MPLYEFRCAECGAEFEKMLRFSEADKRPECPNCASGQTQRKLSAVAALSTGASGGSASAAASCTPRGGFS